LIGYKNYDAVINLRRLANFFKLKFINKNFIAALAADKLLHKVSMIKN